MQASPGVTSFAITAEHLREVLIEAGFKVERRAYNMRGAVLMATDQHGVTMEVTLRLPETVNGRAA